MRSIAHEWASSSAPGAHLESLRRTAVAEFDLTPGPHPREIEGIKNNERIENSNNEQIEDIEKKEQTENKEASSSSKTLSFRPKLRFPAGKGKRSGGTCCP